MISCRRLPLKGLDNARDLGGFITEEGKVTKYNTYIRCEEMSRVTNDDILFLKEYGINSCIDLRSNAQIKKYPSPIQEVKGIQYYTIDADTSFSEKNNSVMYADDFQATGWISVLFGILDGQKLWVGKAMKILAECNKGAILNCNTGRNRSNLISLLVMLIAKVPQVDIVAEYTTNEIYLREKYLVWDAEHVRSKGFYSTPSFVMEEIIKQLFLKYGNVENYLISCGVTIEDIHNIYNSIV